MSQQLQRKIMSQDRDEPAIVNGHGRLVVDRFLGQRFHAEDLTWMDIAQDLALSRRSTPLQAYSAFTEPEPSVHRIALLEDGQIGHSLRMPHHSNYRFTLRGILDHGQQTVRGRTARRVRSRQSAHSLKLDRTCPSRAVSPP